MRMKSLQLLALIIFSVRAFLHAPNLSQLRFKSLNIDLSASYNPSAFKPIETRLRMSTALDTAVSDSMPKKEKSVAKTFKKLFPLGAMLFFILFDYTILRDTKDVLVVTAPNSGYFQIFPSLILSPFCDRAEIIPFLKTYVNLPASVGFTVLYSFLCNRMSTDKVL